MAEHTKITPEMPPRKTVDETLNNPELKAELLSGAFQAAQLAVLEVAHRVGKMDEFKPFRRDLEQAYRFVAERIGTVKIIFKNQPPHKKYLMGLYDRQTHTLNLYRKEIKSSPALLQTTIHELLHSGEDYLLTRQAPVPKDNFLIPRLREFLSRELAETAATLPQPQKSLIKELVKKIVEFSSKKAPQYKSERLPELVDQAINSPKFLLTAFMPGATTWHELQIDSVATEALNNIIKLGKAKRIVGKEDLTPSYPATIVRQAKNPIKLAAQLTAYNGQRGYTSEHQALAWWKEKIFSPPETSIYDTLETIARAYMFFSADSPLRTEKFKLIREALEKSLLDQIERMGSEKFMTVVLWLAAKSVATPE